MLTAVLFIITRNWTQPKCPSMCEWYIHTVESYDEIKRKGLLIHLTTWMELQEILLSAKTNPQRLLYDSMYIVFLN